MKPTWDVAIVGGGPAGALAGYVLAGSGRRVLLVDRDADVAGARRERRKIGESLPAMAGHLLGKLGLRALLDRGHHRAFGNVSSWGGAELVTTDFIHDPHGLGWHLDRARFDAGVRDASRDAGVELRAGHVRAARRRGDGGGWELHIGGTVEDAACVIDATGRAATIARGAGAERVRDDDLVALYSWIRPRVAERETRTLVEAVADGWWYTAPLPGGTRVVALHVDKDVARSLLRGGGAARAAAFARRLAETTHVRALTEEAEPIAPLSVTEACGAGLDRCVGAGWVAVGDAALSFDPIAAQGIFNALYTGMKAGLAVHAALDGNPAGLADYTARIAEIRAAYAGRHAHIHDGERRWPSSTFWSRRHARLAA